MTGKSPAVAGVSKHEKAYREIRERIVNGTYGPGYRLVIDGLANELDVSAVPIREAIRRLEAEGWVSFQRNVGAQVAPVDGRQWADAMYVLALLEGYATATTAADLGRQDLKRARQINDAMHSALEAVDPLLFTRLNRDFHFALYARCTNDFLMGLITQAWDRLDAMRRTVFIYIPARAWMSIHEHAELVDTIERGDRQAEIELLAREHKLHTIGAYLSSDAAAAAAEAPAAGSGGS